MSSTSLHTYLPVAMAFAKMKTLPKFAYTAKVYCILLIIAVILKNIGNSVMFLEIRRYCP